MNPATLLVEDDPGLRSSIERTLRRRGHEVLSASLAAEAGRVLRERSFDLLIVDLRLPDGSGLDLLKAARDIDGAMPVIVMTAFPEVRTAVRAMQEGARDFIAKPFELEELHVTVERALEGRRLRRDLERLEREQLSRRRDGEIVGRSAATEDVRGQIAKVAGADTPVLVVGETGTGKELVADSIHRLSRRRDGPLIKVNSSALSRELLESELFGHEKGAFTDAREARAGLFEMCDGGTLFLDEIAEMDTGLQAKLLRVVEGHPFHRVGGRREVHASVRVVAATNRDLAASVRSGAFRQDLYFRLNVFRIEMPPLRAREGDAAELAALFLARSAAALRKGTPHLTAEAERTLLAYDWPGNVRELRNVIERAVILCETGEVGPALLPAELRATAFIRRETERAPGDLVPLEEIEARYMEHVLRSVGGNVTEAARVLGIARNTLKARLRPLRGRAPSPEPQPREDSASR